MIACGKGLLQGPHFVNPDQVVKIAECDHLIQAMGGRAVLLQMPQQFPQCLSSRITISGPTFLRDLALATAPVQSLATSAYVLPLARLVSANRWSGSRQGKSLPSEPHIEAERRRDPRRRELSCSWHFVLPPSGIRPFPSERQVVESYGKTSELVVYGISRPASGTGSVSNRMRRHNVVRLTPSCRAAACRFPPVRLIASRTAASSKVAPGWSALSLREMVSGRGKSSGNSPLMTP